MPKSLTSYPVRVAAQPGAAIHAAIADPATRTHRTACGRTFPFDACLRYLGKEPDCGICLRALRVVTPLAELRARARRHEQLWQLARRTYARIRRIRKERQRLDLERVRTPDGVIFIQPKR